MHSQLPRFLVLENIGKIRNVNNVKREPNEKRKNLFYVCGYDYVTQYALVRRQTDDCHRCDNTTL